MRQKQVSSRTPKATEQEWDFYTAPQTIVGDTGKQSRQEKPPAEWIRERAYFKWVEAGCPASDGQEFWLAAEKELEVQLGGRRTGAKG